MRRSEGKLGEENTRLVLEEWRLVEDGKTRDIYVLGVAIIDKEQVENVKEKFGGLHLGTVSTS